MSIADHETHRTVEPTRGDRRAQRPEGVPGSVCVRAIDPSEPLPLKEGARARNGGSGLSRALPRYVGGEGVLGFVAEHGHGASRRPVAVAWCVCGPGRSTVEVRWSRRAGVDEVAMGRLFVRIAHAARTRGATWLRWRLSPAELHLLEAVRIAAGVPVLHREGEDVMAEVALGRPR
jgi:hypothetical protein